jgi:hypothetical protein
MKNIQRATIWCFLLFVQIDKGPACFEGDVPDWFLSEYHLGGKFMREHCAMLQQNWWKKRFQKNRELFFQNRKKKLKMRYGILSAHRGLWCWGWRGAAAMDNIMALIGIFTTKLVNSATFLRQSKKKK